MDDARGVPVLPLPGERCTYIFDVYVTVLVRFCFTECMIRQQSVSWNDNGSRAW